MAESAGLLFRIKGDSSDAVKALREAGVAFNQVEGHAKSAGEGIRNTFLGNLAADTVQKFAAQLAEAGKSVLDFSARLEQTKIGFTSLMGSSQAAEKHLKELAKFAQATPFEFESLTNASRRLQNVGLEGSKVIPILTDIGNAAAAAGASSEELDSITLAFSQIIAKGKVSAEEVNQLAERGIPVWRLLSEQLGRSKAEIIDLAEKGKISSDVFLQAFSRFSQMNFGDAMEKQSHTFQGAMSSIKDAALLTSTEAFKPFFEQISRFADDIAASLSAQQAKAGEAGASFGEALGVAIGAGLRRSDVGEGKWWDILFPIGWVSRKAAELGDSIGKGIAQGYTQFDSNASAGGNTYTFDPKTNTIVTGTPNAPKPNQSPLSLGAGADKEAADKAAKELLEAQERLNQAKQDSITEAFRALQEITKKAYDDENITAEKFREQYLENERQFRARLMELTGEEFDAKRAQAKNKTDRLAINIEETTAREKIVKESDDRIAEMEKTITEAVKKQREERERDEKESANYSIEVARARSQTRLKLLENEFKQGLMSEREFIAASIREQVSVLEGEKRTAKSLADRSLIQEKINQLRQDEVKLVLDLSEKERKAHEERVKHWNEFIEKKIKDEEEADERAEKAAGRDARIKQREDEEGSFLGGFGRGAGIDVPLYDPAITDQVAANADFLKKVYGDLASSAGAALGQMAQGLGNLMTQWIVTGKFSAKAALQMASGIAMGLAIEAGLKALMQVAHAIAAAANPLTAWMAPGYYAAAKAYALTAAAAGAVGVGAGLAARAVGGGAVASTAGAATSSGPERRDRNVDGQGKQYSSLEDQKVGGSRNSPFAQTREILLNIRLNSEGVLDVLHNSVKTNGRGRDIILDVTGS